MAWTQEDLDKLEERITGAQRVRHGDKEVQTHDLKAMLELRDQMKREISATPRVYRARPGRG